MSGSTLSGLVDAGHPRAAWARRVALAAVTLFVAADLTGLFGVRTDQVSATGHGFVLSVEYPHTARAGLDVTWRVQVTHPGGFGRTLTLAITGDYFDIFETQGFHPDPDSATRTGDTLLLTFTAPPGEVFVVSYDAYIQPSSQLGRSAHVAVLRAGKPVVGVDLSTHLIP